MKMAKKNKDPVMRDSVDVHQIINPEFMAMSKAEMSEFDKEIDRLQREAKHDLEKTPWRKNEAYLRDDIFAEGAEKGGESDED